MNLIEALSQIRRLAENDFEAFSKLRQIYAIAAEALAAHRVGLTEEQQAKEWLEQNGCLLDHIDSLAFLLREARSDAREKAAELCDTLAGWTGYRIAPCIRALAGKPRGGQVKKP
jgi:hypothetical protein